MEHSPKPEKGGEGVPQCHPLQARLSDAKKQTQKFRAASAVTSGSERKIECLPKLHLDGHISLKLGACAENTSRILSPSAVLSLGSSFPC